jgi:hypothetical protein
MNRPQLQGSYGYVKNPWKVADFLPGKKLSQSRCKTVYTEAYNTKLQRETIQTLYELSCENSGRSREDVKTASRGIYVSSNGKFTDNDGRLGIDYKEYRSVYNEHEEKAILPRFIGSKKRRIRLSEKDIKDE